MATNETSTPREDRHAGLEQAIVKTLRTVRDPEIPVNIHDLGLIYGLEIEEDGRVCVRMTLTAPNCPMADVIVNQVRAKIGAVEGVSAVDVDLVWEPKWTPAMMSEAARLELEFTGHTGPPGAGRERFSSLTVSSPRRPPHTPPHTPPHAPPDTPHHTPSPASAHAPSQAPPGALMDQFIKVARVSDIPEQSAIRVDVNGRRIALVNLGDAIHAIDDTCTHAEASLSEGTVAGEEIVCPLHFAAFEVRTGRCTAPPACEDLATYKVRVNGDDVELAVGE